MLWFKTLVGKAVPVLFVGVFCCPFHGRCQDWSSELSKRVRIVPAPVEPAPFSTTQVRREPVYSVKLVEADQLPPRDRLLVSNAESSITELARSAGLEYSESGWNYREIACPSFASHVFLQFSRNNGRGDVSVFSASIPRNGMGKVRVIPILKRSYSLFSPAPINAITISAFNHIRAEEGQTANDDWLGNALCYSALAGARPQIQAADSWPAPQNPVPPLTAALDVQFNAKGQEVITFDDVVDHSHAMEWTMTFTRSGKLIKAVHKPAEMLHAEPVSQKSAIAKSRKVP